MRTRVTTTRARLIGPIGILALLLAMLAPSLLVTAPVARAQDNPGLAEVPTTGGRRPGPIVGPAGGVARSEGVPPVAIQIDKAGIAAEIERIGITPEGVMQNPTGPWIVSWYQDLGGLGGRNNVVMAGHVDYWNVGPAVFWYLKEPGLAEGDVIRVTAEDQQVFEYRVQWSKTYSIDELTGDVINGEIIESNGAETLTLITCGGEFDYARGEYLSRIVVRAELVTA